VAGEGERNSDGRVILMTQESSACVIDTILLPISLEFDVDIVSEDEPQFWGFRTKDELNEWWASVTADDAEDPHLDTDINVHDVSSEDGT
jgi:hypothetical protein